MSDGSELSGMRYEIESSVISAIVPNKPLIGRQDEMGEMDG